MEADLKALMTQSVTVYDATGAVSEYGARTRSTGVPYPCHVQLKSVEVAAKAGGVVTATGTAWLDGYYPQMDVADSADVPTLGRVPIVAVSHVYDEAGPYYTALYFGAS
jgi:hypothetical protein